MVLRFMALPTASVRDHWPWRGGGGGL